MKQAQHARSAGLPRCYAASMVRRDADEQEDAQASDDSSARCASPTGASPVSVGAGAPSSRPQASRRDPSVRAGRQEPVRRRECAAAKRSPTRRFHALYDRIYRGDVLWEAWKRVRRNRGSAGLDAQSVADVEQHGVELFLEEVGSELRAGTYRPQAVLRRYIPKADGRRRPLGALPPAGNGEVPGTTLLENCVMLHHERTPVSRVREIRTHGLNGGPALLLVTNTR